MGAHKSERFIIISCRSIDDADEKDSPRFLHFKGVMEEENVETTNPIALGTVEAGRRHIFYVNDKGERLNMTAIHRMNMHYIRKRIIDETSTVLKKGEMNDENSKALSSLIQEYCSFS